GWRAGARRLPREGGGGGGGRVRQRGRALGGGDVEAMWAGARERVRVRVGDRNFAAWIAPLSCTRTSGTVTLLAPDRTTRDWVARHFLTAIEEALAVAAGRSCHVQLGVAAPPPILPIPTRAPNAEQTFDTFVVGESNAGAQGGRPGAGARVARQLALPPRADGGRQDTPPARRLPRAPRQRAHRRLPARRTAGERAGGRLRAPRARGLLAGPRSARRPAA